MYTLSYISRLFLSLVILVPSLSAGPISASDNVPVVSIAPEAIQIHAFYKGTDLIVRADLPMECDGAVVKIQGKAENVTLKRKGKVSLFWLNVDDVTVSNAPDIYILDSSDSLENICSPDSRQKLLLGYDALKQQIDIQAGKNLVGSEFSEFIKLKEHYGAYLQTVTAHLQPDADAGHNAFEAVLHIPPVMPSGDYQVHLFYFGNGTLLGESEATLNVEKIGVPKYLYTLAFDHPAFYGLFACIIAMATGIIMSLIFGSRKRKKR